MSQQHTHANGSRILLRIGRMSVRAAGVAGRVFVWPLCAHTGTSESPTACRPTQRHWPRPASPPETAEDSAWGTHQGNDRCRLADERGREEIERKVQMRRKRNGDRINEEKLNAYRTERTYRKEVMIGSKKLSEMKNG